MEFTLILLCAVGGLALIYGNLLGKLSGVKQQQKQLDAQLQQRAELISALCELMQRHHPQEREPLMRLEELGQRSIQGPRWDRMRTDTAISSLLPQMLELLDQNPLHNNASNRHLHQRFVELESALEQSRQSYDRAVQTLNSTLRVFPSSTVAAQLSLTPFPLFEQNRPEHPNRP